MRDLIEVSENILKIVTAIVSVGAAISMVFSTLDYDAFDRKLMPRNKSSVTYLKQITGRFLIINITFIFTSYLSVFFVLHNSYYKEIGYILIGLFIILYTVSLIITFLEWCILKLTKFQFNRRLQKLEPFFSFHKKWEIYLILFGTLAYTTVIADIHLTSTTKSLLSKAMLYEFLLLGIIMSIFTTLLLTPLYIGIKKKQFQLLPLIKSEAQLLEELGANRIYLEYFLNETVIIYSAANQEYKIIKRISDESSPIYEVYKLIDEEEKIPTNT